MSNVVKFKVPGTPVGKGRAKSSSRIVGGKVFTRHYTPEKTVSYENLVALAAQEAMVGRNLIDGPVDVELVILLPVPASWSKKKQAAALQGQVYPTKKPDIDNVEKAIFDAINGVVWHDDVQVCDVSKCKRYAEVPGVHVVVKPIEGALFAA